MTNELLAAFWAKDTGQWVPDVPRDFDFRIALALALRAQFRLAQAVDPNITVEWNADEQKTHLSIEKRLITINPEPILSMHPLAQDLVSGSLLHACSHLKYALPRLIYRPTVTPRPGRDLNAFDGLPATSFYRNLESLVEEYAVELRLERKCPGFFGYLDRYAEYRWRSVYGREMSLLVRIYWIAMGFFPSQMSPLEHTLTYPFQRAAKAKTKLWQMRWLLKFISLLPEDVLSHLQQNSPSRLDACMLPGDHTFKALALADVGTANRLALRFVDHKSYRTGVAGLPEQLSVMVQHTDGPATQLVYPKNRAGLLSSYLRSRKTTAIERHENLRRGLLDENRLTDVAAFGETSVFYQQTFKEGNLAVSLLVDESSSMSGSIDQAKAAAGVLCRALEFNPENKVWVWGHTAERSGINLTELTLYYDPDHPNIDRLSAMRAKSQNIDGIAIRYAGEHLLGQPIDLEKWLVIFSDGAPAASNYQGQPAMTHVAKEVRALREKGIRVFEIAFGSALAADLTAMFGAGWTLLADPKDLPEAMIRLIRKMHGE